MVETLDVDKVRSFPAIMLRRGSWQPWPGGYPGEIELALVDAVYSARARYGNDPNRRVRAVVGRWRAARSQPAQDLTKLADVTPADQLEILGNAQRIPGGSRTKAQVVQEAAAALAGAGIRTSAELGAADEAEADRVKCGAYACESEPGNRAV